MNESSTISRVGFLMLASMLGPYSLWVFVMEREMFSRVPVIAVVVVLWIPLQYFHTGARRWLTRPKSRRFKVGATLCVAALGFMSLLIVPSVLLCFGVCEIVYRFTGVGRLCERYSSRRRDWVVAAGVVLLLFPSMNAMYGIRGGLLRLTPVLLMQNPLYGINASGFRGPALEETKPPGTRRLLFLGDSSTFGWPYRYEDTYAYHVGQEFMQQGLGPVEVINAGIPGQSLVQIFDKLPERLAYQPDFVFLMDGVHFEKSLEHFEATDRNPGPVDHGFRPSFYPPTLVELGVIGLASHPLAASCQGGTDVPARREATRRNEAIAEEALSGIADALAARGIPLVLLEYPSLSVAEIVRSQQQALAERPSVTLLRLLHLFDGSDDYSLRDDIHPDKPGHRRIASAIVADLLERDLLPGHSD